VFKTTVLFASFYNPVKVHEFKFDTKARQGILTNTYARDLRRQTKPQGKNKQLTTHNYTHKETYADKHDTKEKINNQHDTVATFVKYLDKL